MKRGIDKNPNLGVRDPESGRSARKREIKQEKRNVQTINGNERLWGVRIRDWRLFTHGQE
jgi:hypothetical protein